MSTILAIDFGTSSVKAALFTPDGAVLQSLRRPLLAADERPEAFTAERWDRALEEVVRALAAGQNLAAIAISGQGPTVVAVDSDGEPLGAPLLWLDARPGVPTDSPSYYRPRIEWLLGQMADRDRVRWMLPFPEYLLYRLTGEAVAIAPSEAFAPHIWSEADRRALGRDILPPLVPLGSVVGRVTAAAAARCGIAAGVPVVAAGSDFVMSLIGTATLTPGLTCDRAGTSEGINHCSATRVERASLRTLPHAIPGLYNVAGILSSTGLLFEWFRSISGQRGRDYGDMMVDILAIADDSRGPWFFPTTYAGTHWQFRRGMFADLGAEHDRAAMGRAVVVSIGFAVREALESLVAAGCRVTDLRSCGGQAKNGLWTQMKADIVGLPIAVPAVADAELTGALAVALLALGRAKSLTDAAERVVRFVHTYEPRPERTRFFDEEYGRYRERYARFMSAMATI